MRLAIVATFTLAACSGGDTNPDLPLKRGYYNQGESCSDASNASIVLFGRASINWSRAACDLSAIEQLTARRWKAKQSCKDIQGGSAEPPYSVYFDIEDETTFTHRFEGSSVSARYRYCAQASLPEPWRSNEIGDLVN